MPKIPANVERVELDSTTLAMLLSGSLRSLPCCPARNGDVVSALNGKAREGWGQIRVWPAP